MIKYKEEINVKSLIARFEDMAKRETLLTGIGVKQEDLLIQIIGTICREAMYYEAEEEFVSDISNVNGKENVIWR